MTSTWLRLLPRPIRRRLEHRSYAVRLIDSTAWMLTERILRYSTGFVIGIFVARYLGVEQYGLLAYASALVSVLAWLGTLGLDPVVVRELVQRPGQRDDLLGSLIAMRAVGTLLLLLALLALLDAASPADPRARSMAIVIAIAQLPMAMSSIDCWFLSRQATRSTAGAKIVALAILTALRIALILGQAPIQYFAWAMLLEGIVIAGAMVLSYKRAGGDPWRLRPHVARMRELLMAGWPLVAIAAAAAVSQRADQVLIGHLVGYYDLGAYAIAMRFIEAVFLVPSVALLTLYPALVAAYHTDARLYLDRVQALFDVGLWSALAVAVSLWLAAAPLVRLLFGARFDAAVPVLSVLAWLPILTFSGLIRLRVLIAEGALRSAMAVELLACAVNVLVNFLLIPRWGVIGAAAAAIVAALIAPVLAAPFSPAIRRCNWAMIRAVGAPYRLWRAQSGWR